MAVSISAALPVGCGFTAQTTAAPATTSAATISAWIRADRPRTRTSERWESVTTSIPPSGRRLIGAHMSSIRRLIQSLDERRQNGRVIFPTCCGREVSHLQLQIVNRFKHIQFPRERSPQAGKLPYPPFFRQSVMDDSALAPTVAAAPHL